MGLPTRPLSSRRLHQTIAFHSHQVLANTRGSEARDLSKLLHGGATCPLEVVKDGVAGGLNVEASYLYHSSDGILAYRGRK